MSCCFHQSLAVPLLLLFDMNRRKSGVVLTEGGLSLTQCSPTGPGTAGEMALVIIVVDACPVPEGVWVSWADRRILIVVVLVVPTVVFVTSTPQVCPVGDVIFKFLPEKNRAFAFQPETTVMR